jgi:hypothetical protein
MAGTALGKRLRRDRDAGNAHDDEEEVSPRGSAYVGTHIKHMKTSVPVDLRAAKTAKKAAKVANKRSRSKTAKKGKKSETAKASVTGAVSLERAK